MNIAVLCPSEIALRRFMPAIQQAPDIEYIGVGVATPEERLVDLASATSDIENDGVKLQREKAQLFVEDFGGKVFDSYGSLLDDPSIEAVYIPLPPGLHFPWAKRALDAGKHVMLEKPFTTSVADTAELLELAQSKALAVHENYMFAFHSQIDYLHDAIISGSLGEVRLLRIDFGFPFRGANDFRYSRELGGGALFDCGGYTLKLAALLLGPSAHVIAASSSQARGFEVDVYGSAMLRNDDGLIAQVSFGMDNDYRCNIDVWGSEASLFSGRILTAPAGYRPVFTMSRNGEKNDVVLDEDDSFCKSIEHFAACVTNPTLAQARRAEILHQSQLVDAFMSLVNLI